MLKIYKENMAMSRLKLSLIGLISYKQPKVFTIYQSYRRSGFMGFLGDRQGEFAIDVQHPKRLIIIPANGDLKDLKTVTKIKIIEIINYH